MKPRIKLKRGLVVSINKEGLELVGLRALANKFTLNEVKHTGEILLDEVSPKKADLILRIYDCNDDCIIQEILDVYNGDL